MEKIKKIENEMELSRKMMDGSVKVKVTVHSKFPTHDKIKVEMGVKGVDMLYSIEGAEERGKDHTGKIIEMSNKLVDAFNKYIDDHPELGNEPKISFVEIERMVKEGLGKYSKTNRIVMRPTKSGRVKVAFQQYDEDYEGGINGDDYPSPKKSKDNWYDAGHVWTLSADVLEKQLADIKDVIMNDVKEIVREAAEMEEIVGSRKKAKDMTDDELRKVVAAKRK